jgi:hypothetical protein
LCGLFVPFAVLDGEEHMDKTILRLNAFQTCCVTSLLVQIYLCVGCKLLLHICVANITEALFALGALKKSVRGPPQLTQNTFFVFTSVHFDSRKSIGRV